jgi:hypothetical protein
MVNKRTSINKAHFLLLVRQAIMTNIVAWRFSSSTIFTLAYFVQCTEPTPHLICCVRSGLLIFLICWFAVSTVLGAKNRVFFRRITSNINTRGEPKKPISYYETWIVNTYKKQCPINIYLLDVEWQVDKVLTENLLSVFFFVERLYEQNHSW